MAPPSLPILKTDTGEVRDSKSTDLLHPFQLPGGVDIEKGCASEALFFKESFINLNSRHPFHHPAKPVIGPAKGLLPVKEQRFGIDGKKGLQASIYTKENRLVLPALINQKIQHSRIGEKDVTGEEEEPLFHKRSYGKNTAYGCRDSVLIFQTGKVIG